MKRLCQFLIYSTFELVSAIHTIERKQQWIRVRTILVLGYWVLGTLVSVLVLGTGIARGQCYWVLDIGCLSWYRSNPTVDLEIYDMVMSLKTLRICDYANRCIFNVKF